MISSDDIGSVNSIQTALFLRFPDRKFIVMCALAGNNTGPLQNQVNKIFKNLSILNQIGIRD